MAYRITTLEVLVEAKWQEYGKINVTAKADAPLSDEQRWAGVQTILAERFHLKFHHETKEQSTFALVIAKSGLKVRESAAADDGSRPKKFKALPGASPGTAQIASPRATMKQLAAALSSMLQIVVSDETGRPETFDIKLEWAPEQMQKPGDSQQVFHCSLRCKRNSD